MAGLQRAGKGAGVSIDGIALNFAEWRANFRGDDLDTTNFEDEGAETGLIGITVIEWDTGGDWDAEANPIADPPGFYPRDDLANMQFYTSRSDNVFWFLGRNRVLSGENGAQVRAKVAFRASGKSNGGAENLVPVGSV